MVSGLLGVPFARERDFPAHAFLIEAADTSDCVYLIAQGQVRCFILNEDGSEATTAVVGPGHLVGIAGVLGLAQHHVFAETLTPVRTWAMPTRELVSALPHHRMLLGAAVGSLAHRLAFAQGLLRDVLLLTVADRLSDVQHRLSVILQGRPPALTRSQLALLVQTRPETLTRVPTPKPTTATQRSRAQIFRMRPFHAGEVLGEIDPPPGHIHQVIRGRLQIALRGAHKREVRVDEVAEGEFLGFMDLVGMPPAGLQAVALSDGALRTLSAPEFLDEVVDHPEVLQRVLSQLGACLLETERRLAIAASGTVRERVLVQLGITDRDPSAPVRIGRDISHSRLARQLGSSRETITRTLGSLEKEGLVVRDGKRPPSPQRRPARATTTADGLTAADRHAKRTEPATVVSTSPTGRPEAAQPAASFIPIDLIDEPPAAENTRRSERACAIAELAASIREEGILQPLCVRPAGDRFRLVYGFRRLRAARMAGLKHVPCTIRVLEDDRAFLINLIENLQRQQLTGVERVRAIERLAATGLGVRAIGRRTGFDASTISRWLRIPANPAIRAAVEEERLDITRAKILVQVPPHRLPELLARAPSTSISDLRLLVAGTRATARSEDRRLRQALHLLRSITQVRDARLMDEVAAEVARLRGVVDAGRTPSVRYDGLQQQGVALGNATLLRGRDMLPIQSRNPRASASS